MRFLDTAFAGGFGLGVGGGVGLAIAALIVHWLGAL